MNLLSSVTKTFQTIFECPLNTSYSVLSPSFQTPNILSLPANTSNHLLSMNFIEFIIPVCPLNSFSCLHSLIFQSLSVLSTDPDAALKQSLERPDKTQNLCVVSVQKLSDFFLDPSKLSLLLNLLNKKLRIDRLQILLNLN